MHIKNHTLEDQTDYWWAVDLGQEFNINTIAIYNRIDCCALKICKNIALNKDTMQSSYFIPSMGSSQANDGNREQNELAIQSFICSHTLEDQTDYWWAVDLGQEFNISTITIYNRIDCCGFRLTDFEIFIYNPSISNWTNFDQEQEQLCFFHKGAAPSVLSIACNRIIRGRYIKIYKKYHYFPDHADGDALSLCEVEVFADHNHNEGFYCKQINKQPMMRVQMDLANFTDFRCARSCRNIDNCLGFTMASDGTCSLFQTSKYLPSGNNDSEYFEKC
ncbi:unnamed protein product [Mytilus edulis]|uniref:Fucolectin tachylectin-4 pentraxin-1 domain-containing protein n=1 Tax=Mytilus edulis TaxID=6550 RepID=A0A8S3RP62_MYTED|nr:unnamed protein product [Mytilus edulis]